MKKSFFLLLSLGLLTLQGCTHSIHMVHTDGFGYQAPKASQTKTVEASAEQTVVMSFAFDTNYVDEAKAKLESQCKGDLAAVSTQYSTSHGFLHWTNKIRMKGICVQ